MIALNENRVVGGSEVSRGAEVQRVRFNVWVVLVRSPCSVLATKAVIGVVHAGIIS